MRQPFNPRAKWLMKPILGTRVDPSHDLAPSAGMLLSEGGGVAPVALYGAGVGVFAGTPTWVTGIQGSAVAIGTTSAFITLPAAAAFQPALPLTIKARILITSIGAFRIIATLDGSTSSYAGPFLQVNSSGFLAINYGDNTGTSAPNRRTITATNNVMSVNRWYDVVGVITGPTTTQLYVNGAACTTSSSGSGGAMAYSGTAGRIGSFAPGGALTLSGSIDQVLIWPRALTAAEVALLYVDPWCFMLPPAAPRFWLVPTGGAAPYAHRTLGNRAGSRTLRPASGEL